MATFLSDGDLLELQHTLYASKNPTRRWLHCSRRDWILSAIHRYRDDKMWRALEIGPGSGIYLPTLATLFDTVVAADIETQFLSQATSLSAQHPNIEVVHDDIVNSHFPSASFDLILCSEVIEHIRDSQAALEQIARILRPGGVLILSTPQKFSLLEMTAKIAFLPGVIELVRMIYREPVIETGHINLLTVRATQAQLSHAGLTLRERHVSGLYLPVMSEMFGKTGLRWAMAGERLLYRLGLTGILWTQFYVAVRLA